MVARSARSRWARTTQAIVVALAASLTVAVAPASSEAAPPAKPKAAGKKKGAAGKGAGKPLASKGGAPRGGAGGVAIKPSAEVELPKVIARARVERRLEGGPTFVTTTGDAGLFLHVDFGVSQRHDPEARPGLGELATRAWLGANAALWAKVEGRGGTVALSRRGDRFGVAIALPRGEETFAGWLLPRLFDHTTPPREVIAEASRAVAESADPVRDALVESLFQGARALSHRPDAARLANVDGAEIATFLRAWLAPERATIGVVAPEGAEVCGTACVAGFASLAGHAAPSAPMPTPPEQTLQRTVQLDLGGAPAFTYGFLFPADPRREAALRIAGAALCDPHDGRLTQKLRATGATCATRLAPRDGPGIFTLRVEGAEEDALSRTIARVDEELLALSKSPLPKGDFDRARARALVTVLEEAADPARVAAALAQGRPDPAAFAAAASAMDPAALADELGRGLNPLRRAVVVERRGTERLWKTPRPAGAKKPDAKKPDVAKPDAKKPAGKPGGKPPAKRRR